MDLQQQILTKMARIEMQNVEILKHLRASHNDTTMVTAQYVATHAGIDGHELNKLRRAGSIIFVRNKKTNGYRYSWESILKLKNTQPNGNA